MKVINISDKLTSEKPLLVLSEDKKYQVDNSLEAVLKIEETMGLGGAEGMVKAIEIALGKQAAKELDIKKMSIENIKIIITAILAAVQGMSYEEASSRFQQQFEEQ